VLKGTAALVAGGVTPAVALAATAPDDPIYALIEEHRRLYKAYGHTFDPINALEDQGEPQESSKFEPLLAARDAACDSTAAAERALVEIATTPAGWAALLRYEDEHRRAGGAFVDLAGGERWRMGLLRRMAASLDGKPVWSQVQEGWSSPVSAAVHLDAELLALGELLEQNIIEQRAQCVLDAARRRAPGSVEPAPLNDHGESIAWNRLHDLQYELTAKIFAIQPRTVTGFGVLARAMSLVAVFDFEQIEEDEGVMSQDDIETVQFIKAACAFAGVEVVRLHGEDSTDA
jgi:hypothetical protein